MAGDDAPRRSATRLFGGEDASCIGDGDSGELALAKPAIGGLGEGAVGLPEKGGTVTAARRVLFLAEDCLGPNLASERWTRRSRRLLTLGGGGLSAWMAGDGAPRRFAEDAAPEARTAIRGGGGDCRGLASAKPAVGSLGEGAAGWPR